MIKKSSLPTGTLINQYFTNIHYQDCLVTEVNPSKEITVSDAAKAFFLCSPQWVHQLMKLRYKIAGLFSLKTDKHQKKDIDRLYNSNFETGEKFGLFEILFRSENEIIMGANDRHLNFRVTIYLQTFPKQHYQVYIGTVVQLNNFFGKIYFFVVQPFHKFILLTFMKKIKASLNTM